MTSEEIELSDQKYSNKKKSLDQIALLVNSTEMIDFMCQLDWPLGAQIKHYFQMRLTFEMMDSVKQIAQLTLIFIWISRDPE